MSTERPTRRALRGRRPGATFGRSLAVVLAVLVLVGGVGAAVSLTQGPRAGAAAVDALAVAEAAGQRVVFTTNQPLAPVTAEQVSVEPDAPFTIAASGRNIAVQFTYALDPDTEYTVRIDGVTGASGGPASTLRHTFTTGTPPLFVLQRQDDADDAIFSTNLAGDRALPVFTDEQIEDYRASRTALVVQTTDAAGAARLVTTGLDGSEPTELALPGEGTIAGLQVADQGGFVGYTYTDLDISASGGIESTLFIASLSEPGADPVAIDVGEDSRVVQWAFVPETSALIVLTFDGQLRLVDTADLDAEPVLLGGALALSGIERGTARAIVERNEGTVVIDLTDLSEEPLVAADGAESLGIPGPVTPSVAGSTLRTFTRMGEDGFPAAQSVVRVDADGAVTPLLELADPGDAVMQTCASPSGRYAAVIVTPDLVSNAYDTYTRPLPTRIETHIIDTRDGEGVTVIEGTDISWCQVAI